ncbi:hypothetical protein BD626DRAFT_158899 [Schizophyllum amplum]|uniref:F-box domain-containing protein n=1 Tax=Schizophyllum amplum TaxID=97359 RepID=A0A550CNS4_9AGAR|nr:hypothetical protein BD626DRAFT_158899 [Auriculariopsis ampla]
MLQSLPGDLHYSILLRATPLDILSLRKTCRALNAASNSRALWVVMAQRLQLDTGYVVNGNAFGTMSRAKLEDLATSQQRILRIICAEGPQNTSLPREFRPPLAPVCSRSIPLPAPTPAQPERWTCIQSTIICGGQYVLVTWTEVGTYATSIHLIELPPAPYASLARLVATYDVPPNDDQDVYSPEQWLTPEGTLQVLFFHKTSRNASQNELTILETSLSPSESPTAFSKHARLLIPNMVFVCRAGPIIAFRNSAVRPSSVGIWNFHTREVLVWNIVDTMHSFGMTESALTCLSSRHATIYAIPAPGTFNAQSYPYQPLRTVPLYPENTRFMPRATSIDISPDGRVFVLGRRGQLRFIYALSDTTAPIFTCFVKEYELLDGYENIMPTRYGDHLVFWAGKSDGMRGLYLGAVRLPPAGFADAGEAASSYTRNLLLKGATRRAAWKVDVFSGQVLMFGGGLQKPAMVVHDYLRRPGQEV